MLVSEIITRFRRQIGDDGTVQFTDTDLIRWINDACREIAQDNDILQVKATSATTSGVGELSLPTNVLRLHSVRWDGVKLKPLSINEWDEYISQSGADTQAVDDPTHAMVWANSLNLFPRPPTSTTRLTLLYARTPVDVTLTSQTPDVPETYHLSIVRYCLAQAAEMDDDPQLYQAKMGEFAQDVQKKKDDREMEDDFYPSIFTSGRDSGGDWGSL